MRFFLMSQGFLGQKMWPVGRARTDGRTHGYTEWLLWAPFQGFRILFFNLSPRIGPKYVGRSIDNVKEEKGNHSTTHILSVWYYMQLDKLYIHYRWSIKHSKCLIWSICDNFQIYDVICWYICIYVTTFSLLCSYSATGKHTNTHTNK